MSQGTELIRQTLQQAFQPTLLQIEDESWKHAGHAGVRESGGGHFVVRIAAQALTGKSRLQCHRMIHQVLAPLFPSVIHALSIHIECGDQPGIL